MITKFANAMGRSGVLFFGVVNLTTSLVIHFVSGPHWAGLMSFGLMGAVCIIASPFVPKTAAKDA